MFEPFAHFLSYGSTDQLTIRTLSSRFQGMVVPGTIAAFQAEGTRGFVLSLSAADRVPYVIDPRTPLFQNQIESPKKSHLMLADLFGFRETFDRHRQVPLDYWTNETIDRASNAWIGFNTAYVSVAPKAFEKYARRLGKPVVQSDAGGPSWILPPYLTHSRTSVRNLDISVRMWESAATAAAHADVRDLMRPVLAVDEPQLLAQVASRYPDQSEVVVWVSNLDETEPGNAARLAEYAIQVRDLSRSGRVPFALYGGYFAVALRSAGLVGASHGVGFGEHRNHIELKSSGAAPARYYVQRIHRYMPIDLASELWRRDRSLVASYYPEFEDIDPQELDYHQLMIHSVRARADEIARTSSWTTGQHVSALQNDQVQYDADLSKIRLTPGLSRRASLLLGHLPVWSAALARVGD